MLRLRPSAWSGVRIGVQDGRSDVTSGAQGAQNDVSSGAQVQLQLPAQLSNSTARRSGCPFGSRQNADALGEGYKFRQGLDLHFLHHPVAMGLDGAFGPADCVGNLLVGVATNDKQKDFTFARRQCRDMSAYHVQLRLQAARHFMMRNRPLDCPKKIVGSYGLGQKVMRTRLDGPHRGQDVGMTPIRMLRF
jgi:hypothetical protein